MAINYASKYSTLIDEKFSIAALTNSAVNDEFDFVGVNAVNVYSIPTVALGDYTMSGSARYGTATELQDTVQTLTLSQDKAFTFTIDRRNYDDTMMTKEAGKALAREIEEVVIPTIDKYRLASMVTNAGTSGTPTAITSSNAYSLFLDGQNVLLENGVPMSGRMAFISPNFYKNIKLDSSFIKASDMAQDMLVRGSVGMVDGVNIIPVPASYLPTKTEFIITHPVAMPSPIKLSDYRIHENPPGISGWLVEGRIRYDAFVLTNKAKAIYVQKSPSA